MSLAAAPNSVKKNLEQIHRASSGIWITGKDLPGVALPKKSMIAQNVRLLPKK
jgi:hypothetical protein